MSKRIFVKTNDIEKYSFELERLLLTLFAQIQCIYLHILLPIFIVWMYKNVELISAILEVQAISQVFILLKPRE